MYCDQCGEDLTQEFCIEKVEFERTSVYISGHCNKCSTYHQFHYWAGENVVNGYQLQ